MSKSTPQTDIEGLRTTLLSCLKRMEKLIASFSKETSMDTLEAHAEVLEMYWKKTVEANLTINSSTERIYGKFPEAAIYLSSKIKLKSITKSRRIYLFNNSLACTVLSEVVAKISTFKETTPLAELDAYSQLLEKYWTKYSNDFMEIFELVLDMEEDAWLDIQTNQERNKYLQKELAYVEAKLLLEKLKVNLKKTSGN